VPNEGNNNPDHVQHKNHSDDIKIAGRHFDKMTKQAIANARKKGFKV